MLTNSGSGQSRWAGVVLCLLIPGAGQFASGRFRRGLAWFAGLSLGPGLAMWWLAQPGFSSLVPGLAGVLACVALWLVMLWDARRPMPRLGARSWVGWVLLALALLLVRVPTFQAGAMIRRLHSASMGPTLRGDLGPLGRPSVAGDRVLVDRTAYWFSAPWRGDVVVFESTRDTLAGLPEGLYVLRIAGLPGERVALRDGHLTINGKPVNSPAWFSRANYGSSPGPVLLNNPLASFVVPPGHYYLLGDNAAMAYDSRFWGPIPARCLTGRVTRILWPPERIGLVK